MERDYRGRFIGQGRDQMMSLYLSRRQRLALCKRAAARGTTLSDELRAVLAHAPGPRPKWLDSSGRFDLWGEHCYRASLRVTEDEREALETDARRWGLGLAGYLRAVLEYDLQRERQQYAG